MGLVLYHHKIASEISKNLAHVVTKGSLPILEYYATPVYHGTYFNIM